tara:strand:+ start:284 stop:400 length:117 start_codon:yes stop_codon:yes gene_type:complete
MIVAQRVPPTTPFPTNALPTIFSKKIAADRVHPALKTE